MNNDLIPLQSAYIRQSRDVLDNAWIVFDTTEEKIGELPNSLSPKEAMSYLHFARPFELQALNIGIQHGKNIMSQMYESHLSSMQMQLEAVRTENIRLSDKLVQLMESSYE